ncbi:WUSCHEL-related homeobox 9-like isoform X1 [Chenopodium quinoa]|uniref:WUSCHEL-related homeobox 9-like isoform X1 n=1 Tax=Chenopodium quinoa TaxID=63459 RepID=UPI000B77CA8D|nr:WUSCHEL-related homeobox 9-like isoform X1 [Chenopodium quinoa]
MASSNRHWPSMFKSKPCNNQSWSQQHDSNHHQSSLLSNSCGRSSSSNSPFSSGCEERSPEPKPRWNPKPEQIRILEAIFNSGMVNPPRDEIRRIRAQLQEYGQVGDANVFYWFQNRKSRSKHKQRTLQAKTTAATAAAATNNVITSIHHHSPPQPMPASSSSSSSDKASPRKVPPSRSGGGSSSYGGNSSSNNSINNNNNNNSNNTNNVVDQFGNSPTSVNQSNPYFHQLIPPTTTNITTHEFVPQDPLFFPLHQSGGNSFSQGLCFGPTHHDDASATINVPASSDQAVGGFSSLLLGDMFGGDHSKRDHEVEKLKFQQELSFLVTNPPNTSTCAVTSSSPVVPTAISGSLGQLLGVGESGGLSGKSTVFINGMVFELPVGPFNVKEEFGEDAVLVHSGSGHPVMTNEWGVTVHPLQHGASYYLVGCVAASPLLHKLDSTPDLLAPGFPYQWNTMNWT